MRSTILFFFFCLFGLSGSVKAADALAYCPSVHCQYLPLMHNPAAVRITVAMEGPVFASPPLRVIGEVVATGSIPVYGVVIEASAYYDPDPSLISTSLGTTLFTATLPGQVNPFDFFMWDVKNSFFHFKEARIITWTLESDLSYIGLTTVLTVTQVDYGHGTYVDIQVRNDSDVLVDHVKAVVWVLGERDINYLRPVSNSLAPSESAYFSEYLSGVYGIPEERIQALAQGVFAAP